jgi:hypothetical protein
MKGISSFSVLVVALAALTINSPTALLAADQAACTQNGPTEAAQNEAPLKPATAAGCQTPGEDQTSNTELVTQQSKAERLTREAPGDASGALLEDLVKKGSAPAAVSGALSRLPSQPSQHRGLPAS